MTPERAIAELRRGDGRRVGLAFLVSPRHLITCAHVVNAAMGRPPRTSVAPGPAALRLEFPFGGGRDEHIQLRATVVSWLADRGSFDLYDIAALQIDEDLPAGVAVLALAEVDLLGEVQMWGPTEERQFSGHVSGQLMGLVDKSRLQVDQELKGVFRVRPGFSGGPVWQPSTGRVVGILQASSVDDQATDAYVLSSDLIVDACSRLSDPDRPVADPALTVLHLPSLRFGARRHGGEQFSDDDQDPDSLAAQLLDDLAEVQRDSGVKVNVIAVTGDVAEHAKPAEYEMAYFFLSSLRDELRLDLSRLVIVPGRHDVNRGKCEAYFLDQEAEDEAVAEPYWPKWGPYAAMFTRLYGAEFRMDQPWQFAEIPELKLAVAGLNSTIAQTHRDADNYGWLGEEQLHWFASRLESAQERGWFRIGVVHHSPMLRSVPDGTRLRDAGMFADLVAPMLNVVLHGQPGQPGKRQPERASPAILGSFGTGVSAGERSPELPVRYQLIEVHRDRLRVSLRRPDLDHLQRTAISPTGQIAWRDISVRFTQVDAIFPPPVSLVSGHTWDAGRPGEKATGDEQGDDDLLSRMAEVTRLRLPEANVRVVRPRGGGPGYLHVGIVQELVGGQRIAVEQYPIGACDGGATDEQVDRFIVAVGARYLAGATAVSYKLVYDGPPAAAEVRERALLRRNVELLSFAEYQLGHDLRSYAQRQAERLALDSAYAPALYVPQRYTEIPGYLAAPGSAAMHEDLLERLRRWLAEPEGHLVVVLGPFGHGKTFLLRELTRRMHEEGDPAVPVLVHLRDLEKAHDLNQLVAAQLTAGGERWIDLAMFRYLLSEGRIALLFDGFDELAVRVTYDAATRHLDKILQAVDGRAKVVIASRDQHFLTDAEVFSALGDRLATVAGRRVVKLAEFDDHQIAAFLRNRLGGAAPAARWLELLGNIKDLLGLSRNPRMLDFITRIPEGRLLAARRRIGEITAAGLYEELLNEWLRYELSRRDRPGGLPPPTKEQFWHAVTFLALRLWGSTEDGIGVAALGETADEFASLAAPETVSETAPPDRDETAHAIGSGTLLVRDSEGRFTFVHRSVMEWLVARHVANRIIAQEPLPEPERREMSPLMVDFLCDLLGRDRALAWAVTQIGDPTASKGSRENALLVHRQFGVDIVGGRLAGTDLRGENLSGQVLRGAHLVGADLTEAILVGADLTAANLEGVCMVRARLDRSQLTKATLRNVDLTGASLLGVDLTGADLSGATLRGTALVGATVSADWLAGARSTWGMAPPSGELPQLQYRSRAAGMRAVAVGPDLIAAGGDDGVLRIWDPVTGTQLREWTGHTDEVLALDFTADGRWLASGGAGGAVRIWDAASGLLVHELTGHIGRVWSVGFAADGRRLASAGGDGVVKIWDTGTGILQRSLTGHTTVIWSVVFSPDGRWLASAGDGQAVRVWDPATGALACEWIGHAGAVLCLAFSPDGMLASAGADGAVRIWEPATGARVRGWAGHKGPVWSLAFSPDRRCLASAGDDRVVRIWDPATGARRHELTGHTDEVNSVDFAPDGRWLASTGTDRVVRVWDPATGTLIRKWTGHTDEVNSMGFSPDGRWLAAVGDDRMVRIWNPATGTLEHELAGHTGRVWSMAFSPGGRWLASAGADGMVRIWDPAAGILERELAGHTGRVRCLRFTPDRSGLASAGDDSVVRIWDPTTGVLVREWRGHTGRVRSLSYTSDGSRLASGGDDGVVRIWDPATGSLEREWAGHIGAVWAVWFSSDGRRLAVGGTVGKVAILDPATGILERQWTSHTGAVSSVAFSPDGQWVVSAGTVGVVRVWDPATGIERCQLIGHTGAVWSVGFSPDGKLLASAGADSVIRIWDPATGAQRAALVPLTDGWAALGADLKYKLHGNPTGEFWYILGLCRFEPGELDPYVPRLERIPDAALMPEVS
jgi:WD40 repeat protein/3',5'-cyclic AMP phosphodiesterase CpdA